MKIPRRPPKASSLWAVINLGTVCPEQTMSTVALGGDLGIETSTELKTRLAPLVDQAGDLTLDASAGKPYPHRSNAGPVRIRRRPPQGRPPDRIRRLHCHLP